MAIIDSTDDDGRPRADCGTAILLLDHDNLPLSRIGIQHLLDRWLSHIDSSPAIAVGEALIRIYGGWWLEDQMSESRHAASLFYAEFCPSLMYVLSRVWRVRFEFADSLFAPHHSTEIPIRHTFALRPAPPPVARRPGQQQPSCDEPDCEIRQLRKWLYRRRGCTRTACPRRFGDVWYRAEQKQVDIHLALDLAALVHRKDLAHLAVGSDDLDFLPALVTASGHPLRHCTISHLRCRTDRTYLDDVFSRFGGHIVTVASVEGG